MSCSAHASRFIGVVPDVEAALTGTIFSIDSNVPHVAAQFRHDPGVMLA